MPWPTITRSRRCEDASERPVRGYTLAMTILLWLAAVVLVIVGLVLLIQGSILLGIVLMVLGFLVGPGGYSIFGRRRGAI
jgi:Family of unknown function (DUF5699)